jgi:hypothetical protein
VVSVISGSAGKASKGRIISGRSVNFPPGMLHSSVRFLPKDLDRADSIIHAIVIISGACTLAAQIGCSGTALSDS